MRIVALLSLALVSLGLIGCPQKTDDSGRSLPPANVATPPAGANPGLKPVASMPNFAGAAGATSQPGAAGPGTVIPGAAASMPGPGTVIPGVTPPPADSVIKGEAVEVLQVKEYTYVRIKPASGEEVWAAVPKNDAVQVGAAVSIQRDMWMTDFQSPSLNRTFDKIAFGNLL